MSVRILRRNTLTHATCALIGAGALGCLALAQSGEPGNEFPDATHGQASDSAARSGKPQEWMVAPDAELPEDFAPGDQVIYVWNSEPQTLTPFVSRDAYATRLYREIMEQLIWTDVDTLRSVPGLAKSWEVSDDGLTITFHLFENATFSDGHPVSSEDVIFTFDLIMNEAIDAPVTRSYVGENIESWKALDEHTVEFTMKKAYFLSLDICGEQWILPKHIYGDFSPEVYNEGIRELCVGSGPWKIETWDKGNQIVLVRNENYWGPKTPLKKQIIRFFSSELAELQDFRAGKVDLIGPTAEQWTEHKDSEWLQEKGETIKYFSPLGGYSYIGYNLRLPKFADKRVRQALTMLLDRQEMIDTLRDGLGSIVTGPFFFEADQYDDSIEPWPFDPDWAQDLLEEAGWWDSDGDGIIDKDTDGDGIRDPFEIIFLVPSGSSFGDRLQRYVKDKFEVAGIKVVLDQLEWSVFEQRLTERDFEMVSLAWTGSPESDPFQIWHSSQAENRGSNYIGFVNEDVDRLIEEARRTMDYEKRMEMWHEFHAILHEEQPYTFLFNRPSLAFVDGRFKNVRRHPLRLFYSEWYVPTEQQMYD